MSANLNYDLHDSAGFWVARLATFWSDAFQRVLVQYDLTPAQFTVLYTLFLERGKTPGEIASYIQRTGGAVTRLLDNLEQKNLVVRKQGPSRRSVLVELTEQGRELAPKIALISKQTNEKMVASLNEDERLQFKSTLRKIFGDAKRDGHPSPEI